MPPKNWSDQDGSLPAVLARVRRRRRWLAAGFVAALALPFAAGVAATILDVEMLGAVPLTVLVPIGIIWFMVMLGTGLMLRALVLRPLRDLADAAPEEMWEPAQPGATAELNALKHRFKVQSGTISTLEADKQNLSGEVERLLSRQNTAMASLAAAVALTHDKLLLTDGEGRVRDISPTALETLDMNRADVLGRLFQEVVKLYDASKERPTEYPIDTFLPNVIENRSTVPRLEEALLVNRRGERLPMLVAAAAILDPSSTLIGTLVRLEPFSAGTAARAPAATGIPARSFGGLDRASGLQGREPFERRLDELIKIARAQNARHALLFASADGLDAINDQYGHWAGEELLWQIAQILKGEAPVGADAFRVGSQHFAVLAPFCSEDDALKLAEKIRVAVDGREFKWNELRFEATVSIGVVPVPPDAEGHKVLLGLANKALGTAKTNGGNQSFIARPDAKLVERRRADREWVNWVAKRVNEGHAHLISQAIHPARSDQNLPHLLEVLLRIEDNDGAWVQPGAFLPAVVRHNLTAQLDVWLTKRTLRVLKEQPSMLTQFGAVSVNFSRSSLTEPDFAERVSEAVAESGLPGKHLCFEIDALTAINHPSDVHRFVAALQPSGAQFALDRCKAALGLNALASLPIRYVKIHESLVRKSLSNPVDAGYIRWINQVTHDLGRLTIATGVETPELEAAMREIGVDYLQGVKINKLGPLVV